MENNTIPEDSGHSNQETASIRILATSDIHGVFYPWKYPTDTEFTTSNLCQIASAVREYRNENTLLVDGGDCIEGNSADLFIHTDEIHPMAAAMNAVGYDICITGNHDYDYGLEKVRKFLHELNADVLTGNVYDAEGTPIAGGCLIRRIGAVRAAVIGMTTPVIARTHRNILEGCLVTDPYAETEKILKEIEGKYDVLIGLFHMGISDEFHIEHSGITQLCEKFPQFDVMIASHEHKRIEGILINGVLTVMNKNDGETMSVIDLSLEKTDGSWTVTEKTSRLIEINTFAPDRDLMRLLKPYHELAREDMKATVGKLCGGELNPEHGQLFLPAIHRMDTPLNTLILNVILHYTGARVSAAAIADPGTNVLPGVLSKSDLSRIYKFGNTLTIVRMNGRQLKMLLEKCTGLFNTYHPGDLTLSIQEGTHDYNWYNFKGVCYEINVSRESGNRIEHMTFEDGMPIHEDDQFKFAGTNFLCDTMIFNPGAVYEKEDMPELIETEAGGSLGDIRKMIHDYIVRVKKGVLKAEKSDNWKITGTSWDPAKHARAMRLLQQGRIPEDYIDSNQHLFKAITEKDLDLFEHME